MSKCTCVLSGLKVQQRFGGMPVGDERNFKGGIWNEMDSAGPGYASFCREDTGCFEIEDRMRDQNTK